MTVDGLLAWVCGSIKDVVGEAQPRAEVSQEGESKLV